MFSGEVFRSIGNYGPAMQLPQGGPQMFLQPVTLTRPQTSVYKGVPVSHPPPHTSHTLLPPVKLIKLKIYNAR